MPTQYIMVSIWIHCALFRVSVKEFWSKKDVYTLTSQHEAIFLSCNLHYKFILVALLVQFGPQYLFDTEWVLD